MSRQRPPQLRKRSTPKRATDATSVRARPIDHGRQAEATRSGAPAGSKARRVYTSRCVAGTDERQRRGDGDDTPLVLDELGDKLDAFWSLATADDADADKALEEFGPHTGGSRRAWPTSSPCPLLSLIPSDSSKHIASSCGASRCSIATGGASRARSRSWAR